MDNGAQRGRIQRLIVESIVIIASILAAFALDTWWSDVQERGEEQRVLAQLQEEFTAARAELEYRADLHGRVNASAESIMRALREANGTGRPFVTVADTTLAWSLIPATTQLTLGTLEGLVGSGGLSIIRDRALRRALAAWGRLLGEMTEEEVRSSDFVYEQLDPILRKRMDLSGVRIIGTELVPFTVSQEAMLATSRLPVDFETVGAFSTRYSILKHGIAEFGPVFDEVDRILELIEASLR